MDEINYQTAEVIVAKWRTIADSLGCSLDGAMRKLESGELHGTLAEVELRIIRTQLGMD